MSTTHGHTFTPSEAAKACGVSRTTIVRAAAAGRIAGAVRGDDGAWTIPLDGLLGAGYNPGKPSPPEDQQRAARGGAMDRDEVHELQLAVLRAEVREQRTRADGLERERDLYRLMLEQGKQPQTPPESPQAAEQAEPIPTRTPDPARPSTGKWRKALNVIRYG